MTDIDELLKSFDTSFEGLSEKQAQQRLKKYGYNVISADKQENAFIKLLSEFASPLVVLLFTIVIISFFIGEIESAIIIIAMIIINVFMTFFQEYQADKAAEKLKKMVESARKKNQKGTVIEIEVSNIEEFNDALTGNPDIIMLDNMSLKEIKAAVALRRDEGHYGLQLEASGGINLKNVKRTAATGVDMISIGALTHSVPAADISLNVVQVEKREA